MTNPDPIETLITQILDAEPVLEDPHMDPALMSAFTTDVAEDINPPEVIARNYGFASPEHMVEFLTKNKGVRKAIKAKRAAFNANTNIEAVNRKKANFVISEAMASMAAPMFDSKVAAAVRLDTLKVFSRMAGIDGAGAAAASGPAGAGGTGFTVNFMFSGQPTQSITTVVDAQPNDQAPLMPALAAPESEL